jgi:hypothetical protein
MPSFLAGADVGRGGLKNSTLRFTRILSPSRPSFRGFGRECQVKHGACQTNRRIISVITVSTLSAVMP